MRINVEAHIIFVFEFSHALHLRMIEMRMALVAGIGITLWIGIQLMIRLKVVDCGLQLVIDRMTYPVLVLIFKLNENYMATIGQDGITSVVHVSVRSPDFDAVIDGYEIQGTSGSIFDQCDPRTFVSEIRICDSSVARVADSETLSRDVVYHAAADEEVYRHNLPVV